MALCTIFLDSSIERAKILRAAIQPQTAFLRMAWRLVADLLFCLYLWDICLFQTGDRSDAGHNAGNCAFCLQGHVCFEFRGSFLLSDGIFAK